VSVFLTERENIRIEEMCDAIKLALEEAERDDVVFNTSTSGGLFVLEEVRDRARAVGYVAELSGGVLTVKKKPETPR
jgi:hypothetical protein